MFVQPWRHSNDITWYEPAEHCPWLQVGWLKRPSLTGTPMTVNPATFGRPRFTAVAIWLRTVAEWELSLISLHALLSIDLSWLLWTYPTFDEPNKYMYSIIVIDAQSMWCTRSTNAQHISECNLQCALLCIKCLYIIMIFVYIWFPIVLISSCGAIEENKPPPLEIGRAPRITSISSKKMNFDPPPAPDRFRRLLSWW